MKPEGNPKTLRNRIVITDGSHAKAIYGKCLHPSEQPHLANGACF
jgi:hypothetical protein